jgi:type IV fimbrial biogenesis protein FimT
VLKIGAKNRSLGFSMIELMVTLTVAGILAAIAVPSFQVWIENSQIRTSAESIKSGIQRARSEAVSRNARVAFNLGVGLNWQVNEVGGVSNPLDARSVDEGSARVTVVPYLASGTKITFNSLGAVVANDDGTVPLTGVTVDSSALSASQSQDLRITVGAGGNARICDPNAFVGSVRACQ